MWSSILCLEIFWHKRLGPIVLRCDHIDDDVAPPDLCDRNGSEIAGEKGS